MIRTRFFPAVIAAGKAANAQLDYYRKMMKAARMGAQVVPEWQPIETAPKDGRKILLGYPLGFSEEGFWMGDPEANHWREVGWFATDDNVLCDRPRMPTYWMPLPKAPTKEVPWE